MMVLEIKKDLLIPVGYDIVLHSAKEKDIDILLIIGKGINPLLNLKTKK
jgi:hypothetical protein